MVIVVIFKRKVHTFLNFDTYQEIIVIMSYYDNILLDIAFNGGTIIILIFIRKRI